MQMYVAARYWNWLWICVRTARHVEVEHRAHAPAPLVGPPHGALLREDELDHVLDRRVLDGQVGDLLLRQQPRRTRAISALGTRSVTRSPSRSTTSP